MNCQQLKSELDEIRNNLRALIDNLNILEVKIGKLQAKESVSEQAPAVNIPIQEAVPEVEIHKEELAAISVPVQAMPVAAGKTDMEVNLGKFWLNKAGIIVFSLGIAFLITYTFKYFGPLAKIAFGYLVAAALFIFGSKLEKKDKFLNYSRVLFGGAWAIAYFTTYAMYNFEASKIINSQLLDLFLLSVVALGIIAHSLKYRSEALTAVALFIGYFTSTLGDVGYFSLVNAGLLAIVALVLVYKIQWIKTIFLGIFLTYLTHLFWVIKQISFSRVAVGPLNVENVYFLLDAGFLSVYWALFTLAILGVKDKTEAVQNKLSAANFANFFLFFFMAYPKLYVFYPGHKFNFILGLGLSYLAFALMMDIFKRNKLFYSNIIIAVSLLTMAIPLKFLPYHTTVIWFIELPFLLFVGLTFNRRIYRYLSFALLVILFFRITMTGWYSAENLYIFGLRMHWRTFLAFVGFFSTSLCFIFYRNANERNEINAAENIQKNCFSAFACVYLTTFLWEIIDPLWLTSALSLESLLIFIIAAVIKDKFIRWYALAVLFLGGMRFCFIDRYNAGNELMQLVLTTGPLACAFLEYAVYRKLKHKSLLAQGENSLSAILFMAAASLLVFTIVVYAQPIWITLSMAIAAVLILLWGKVSGEKCIRYYSLAVMLAVGFRLLFIDTYREVGSITQWVLICFKLACAYAAYFIYSRLKNKSPLDEDEKLFIGPLFYGSTFLVVWEIFQYIKDIWVSVALGVTGALLFSAGFLIKDKRFRIGGFIIFAITLLRIVFVDLSGLPIIYKIISFIILGILFLAISFIYTKSYRDKQGTS